MQKISFFYIFFIFFIFYIFSLLPLFIRQEKETALLPDVFRLVGVVVYLLWAKFEVVHVELEGSVLRHLLEADVVSLVGVHRPCEEDSACTVFVGACHLGVAAGTCGIEVGALHVAVGAEFLVDFGIVVIVVDVGLPSHAAGGDGGLGASLESSRAEVHGDAHGDEVVEVVAPVELHDAAGGASVGDRVAALVGSQCGYGRQAADHVKLSVDAHLVALVVVPAVGEVAHSLVEIGVAVHPDVLEVAVYLIVGEGDALVACIHDVGAAYVVVGHLGPHGAEVEAEACATEVVSGGLVIDKELVEGVEHGVRHVVASRAVGFAHEEPFLGGVAVEFVVGAVAPVVQFGEAVEENASALAALEDLEEAALAHRHVVLRHGHAQFARLVVVALLVVVIDQVIGGEACLEVVVGDELVEEVVLALVVLVTLGIGIDVEVGDVLLDVLGLDFRYGLSQGLAPELVRLGKASVAVVAVLGRIGVGVHVVAVASRIVGNHSREVEPFVFVVAHHAKGVDESAGICQHGSHVETFRTVVEDLREEVAQGVVGGSDDRLHAVDDTVGDGDVPVPLVDGAVRDEHLVRGVAVVDGELAVQHVGQGDFRILLDGEGEDVVALLEEVLAVDDAVQDNDLADAVERGAVAEGIPRGSGNEFLRHEGVEIILNGLVGGSEYRVVASGTEELLQGGLRHLAGTYLAQQVVVDAELLMGGKVVGDGVVLVDIAGGCVDVFRTGYEGAENTGRKECQKMFFHCHFPYSHTKLSDKVKFF